MVTMYVASTSFNTIRTVDVIRYTNSSVWMLGGSRRSRVTSVEQFFMSWGEAHALLLDAAASKLQAARNSLARAQSIYGNVKGMKPDSTAKGRK